MRVAVLAGGKGTRLGEPIKCLTEVAGRPFMDWKIEQLERMGATDIVLIVGPFVAEFRQRYSVEVVGDPQLGIRATHSVFPDDWFWTMGDVLLEQPLKPLTESTMYVRYDENPNIAGLFLDCGLYFGKRDFRLVPTAAKPYHINTPADLGECDAYLRRHSFAS